MLDKTLKILKTDSLLAVLLKLIAYVKGVTVPNHTPPIATVRL